MGAIDHSGVSCMATTASDRFPIVFPFPSVVDNNECMTFIARVVSAVVESGVLTVGVADADPPNHYLLFQRAVDPSHEEDAGLYVEYDDQLQSGYGNLRIVALSKGTLTVVPIGTQHPACGSGLIVSLDLSSAELDKLAAALTEAVNDCALFLDMRHGD